MPELHAHVLHADAATRLARVGCDGVDPPRARDEVFGRDQVIVALRGAFSIRGAGGRAVVDPTRAVVVRAGDPLVFGHPHAGGDRCLSVQSPIATALLDDHATTQTRALPAGAYVRLRALAHDRHTELAAVEEELAIALAPERAPRPSPRDGALVEALRHELGRGFADHLRLDELARRCDVSVFHACRVFRRVTGQSIHRHRLELRLRHALAAILDGGELARVALDTGFASQAHLTTAFGRRFGVTPGRVRAGAAARIV